MTKIEEREKLLAERIGQTEEKIRLASEALGFICKASEDPENRNGAFSAVAIVADYLKTMIPEV